MKWFFKLINFFLTTLSWDLGTAPTWTLTITDKIVDWYTLVDWTYKFHIVVDLPNRWAREVLRIWKVVWNTLYYDKRISPVWINTHLTWSLVQINDVSEMLNSLSQNVDMFWYTENKTGLTVTCYGWNVRKNWLSISVIDTDITVADNSTSLIWLDFVDWTIKIVSNVTTFKWYILSEVVSLWWIITTITEKRDVSLWFELDVLNFSETAWVIKIIWKSITTAQLADLWVTTAKLADLWVTTAKLANISVTTAKIADWNITWAKLDAPLTASIALANLVVNNWWWTKVLHDDWVYKDVYWIVSWTLADKIVTPTATPAMNTDWARSFSITWLAQDITSMTTNLTWSPSNWQMIRIDITDDWVAPRNIFWWSSFENSTATLPLSTSIWTRIDIALVFDWATSKWRCLWVTWNIPKIKWLLIINEEQASGTVWWSWVAWTYNTRILNTIKENSIVWASLTANKITLPAWKFLVEFFTTWYMVNNFKWKIQNITTATTVVVWSSWHSQAWYPINCLSIWKWIINIASSNVFALQMYFQTNYGTGNLWWASTSWDVETYSWISIQEI